MATRPTVSDRFAVWNRADANCEQCGGLGVVLVGFTTFFAGDEWNAAKMIPVGAACHCILSEPRFYLPSDEQAAKYGA